MAERRPVVGIDATPMESDHRGRGIGRHVTRTFEAIVAVAPSWAEDDLGTLVVHGQPAPLPGTVWQTWRAPFRPQDIDPVLGPVADRVAVRRHRPRHWHQTNPLVPFSPLPAARTFVSVYDAIPIQEPAVWATIRAHRRLAYRRFVALARASGGVIASLSSTAADIETAMGIPAERIAVVPPYVRRLAEPSRGTAVTPTEDGHHRLVFVGVLDPHKRADLAVRVVAELVRRGDSATLTFVNARPAHARDAIRRLAAGLGVSREVGFLDRLDDDALDALYAGSTLLATSRVEGFGQPPIEAILAGGRVVAVPIPAYLETVGGLATFAADATAVALADAAQTRTEQPDEAVRSVLATRYGAAVATAALRDAYERFARS